MKTVVIMKCGELCCGIDRGDVREIAPLPALAHPPSLPSSVDGVMDLGGEAILVVSLSRLLGATADADTDPIYRHIVVMGPAAEGMGLLVDRVEDVRLIDDASFLPADPETTLNGSVVALAEWNGVHLHMLDANRIFLAAETARFADIRRLEQARLDALEPT